MKAILASLLCVLSVLAQAPADDPFKDAVKLDDPAAPKGAKGTVDKAIKALEGLQGDAATPADLKKKLDCAVKGLRSRFDKGFIRVMKSETSAFDGVTRGLGGLEAAGKDNSAPEGKGIILNPPLTGLSPDSEDDLSGCDPQFLILLETLIHEGVHLCQPIATAGGDASSAESVKQKIQEISDESSAYSTNLEVVKQLKSALSDIDARKGAPTWAGLWASCPNIGGEDGLVALLLKIESAKDKFIKAAGIFLKADGSPEDLDVLIERYGKNETKELKNILDKLAAAGTSITGEVKVETWIDNTPDVKKALSGGGGRKHFIWNNPRTEDVFIDGEKRKTGIDHVQHWQVVSSVGGEDWLIICGDKDVREGPLGVVRAIPLDKKSKKEAFTVVEDSQSLNSATSLVVIHGRVLVYSPLDGAAYRLMDSDGDGIPDQMTPGNVLAPSAQGELAFRWSLTAIGDSLAALPRHLSPRWNESDWIIFRDQDSDGIFETKTVSDPRAFFSIPVMITGTPVAQGVRLPITGAQGHAWNLEAQNQILAQGQFAPGANPVVLVTLNRPLQPGETVTLRDLTNNTSDSRVVPAQRAPEVYQTIPARISLDGDAVVLEGEGLEAVQAVRIAGVAAYVTSVQSSSITLQTPRLGFTGAFEIELQLQDGTTRIAALDLFTRAK